MPFRFSLQEVLDYRSRILEQRQRETAAVRGEIDRIEGLMAQAREMRDRQREDMNRRALREGLGLAWREIYVNYIEGIDALIERSRKHVEDLERVLEERRRMLAEASKEVRVMEELRDEELEQYLLEERRAEMKEYDEIAIRNFLTGAGEKTSLSGGGLPL